MSATPEQWRRLEALPLILGVVVSGALALAAAWADAPEWFVVPLVAGAWLMYFLGGLDIGIGYRAAGKLSQEAMEAEASRRVENGR